MSRTYAAIDLKSFYASVECVQRNLDPMTTNLVVADASRTEKTICLAVSPSLKAYGIPGRARLFEVVQKVGEVNARRRQKAPGKKLIGEACDAGALKASPELALSYITATPRMALYIEYSTRIYNIYQKYVRPEDIHVYSIDEVFIDLTDYRRTYALPPRELAQKLMHEVFNSTGITATAGIGENLYLCKVAMDILAKRAPPDADGVRIAELDEMSYRRLLWEHRPLTDFWRVGRGYARKLESIGLFTMGDIARRSLQNEESLYKLFGVNAELLIDHAWGWEPCTMAQVKAYKPGTNSISAGQVLQNPYPYGKARLVVREMAEQLALDLAEKERAADQLILTIGYDVENLTDPEICGSYTGEVTTDRYGRSVPKHAHGTAKLNRRTASGMLITKAVLELYERIANKKLLVRRITLAANNVTSAKTPEETAEQLDLFTDQAARDAEAAALARERNMQKAMLNIKKKFGKNAILKGTDLEEGATAIQRNSQIGGHKA